MACTLDGSAERTGCPRGSTIVTSPNRLSDPLRRENDSEPPRPPAPFQYSPAHEPARPAIDRGSPCSCTGIDGAVRQPMRATMANEPINARRMGASRGEGAGSKPSRRNESSPRERRYDLESAECGGCRQASPVVLPLMVMPGR